MHTKIKADELAEVDPYMRVRFMDRAAAVRELCGAPGSWALRCAPRVTIPVVGLDRNTGVILCFKVCQRLQLAFA